MCTVNAKTIKCVVWDLDNTIWEGTLLEDRSVALKNGISERIRDLDKKGILQTIASKNESKIAMGKLKEFGLAQYFLYPQINWQPKSESIKTIAKELNISTDSFLFVDDQEYERDEVKYNLPEVNVIDANDLINSLDLPGLNPQIITEDSALRRRMYLNDFQRKKCEEEFEGPNTDFLESLEMKLDLFHASESDLERAVELTERTNQLNSTGITYSFDQLKTFVESPGHLLLMARLNDKFGTYGHIGLILIEKTEVSWIIKLFLMSCRVMTRGVGTTLLASLMNSARKNGIALKAEFKSSSKNRVMNVTYRFAGFTMESKDEGIEVLKHDLKEQVDLPNYIRLISEPLS